MSEQDAREQSTGSTPAPADPALEAGVRTDDDGPVDPQEQVEERLQQIEDEQRDHEPRHGGGEDEGADRPEDDEHGVDERGADDEAATASGAGDADADAASGPEGAPDADAASGPEGAAAPPTSRASGDDADDDAGDDPRVESDEERRAREEAFAAEHDPDDHDVAAGEEFRQAGDWTAETGKLTEDDVTSGEGSSDDAPGTEAHGSAPSDSAQHEDTQHGEQERGVDGRRVSSVEEIRDGGYGVGSAAPLDDGAVPLDHTVKAWEDTRTYLVPGEEGYDGADPHVWFLDDRSAERAGFDHAG